MFKFFKRESKKLIRAFFHPTFLYLIVVGNLFLFAAILAVYYFEHLSNPRMKTFMDCLWWGVATITTVGFGDVVPLTLEGRIIGIILMYTGTVMFVSFIGILATRWMHEEVQKGLLPIEKEVLKEESQQIKIQKTMDEIIKRLDRLEK